MSNDFVDQRSHPRYALDVNSMGTALRQYSMAPSTCKTVLSGTVVIVDGIPNLQVLAPVGVDLEV